MMTRRKKIILFTVIALVALAIFWFLYSKSQQSHTVKSANGNVSSLFPFTGTNGTDYGAEPNSGAPSNDYTTAGYGNGNNGLGTSGVGGNANSNGLSNVLNLNDLQVGNNNNGNGNGSGNGNGGGGNGGSGLNLGLNGIGNNNGNGSGNGNGNGNGCQGCNPYYGQITLEANGVSSANVTSDGGIVELAWTVGNGADPSLLNTVCSASSSDGSWTGTKDPAGGPDTLNIAANASSTLLSYIYTITCTGIGSASAVVNEASLLNGDIINGSSIKITANGTQSAGLPSTGGRANLSWNVVLPSSYHGDPIVSCTASGSAGDWTGGSNMPSTINGTTTATSSVTLPTNNGDDIVTNIYTINCAHVGIAIATVNVDSLMHGGIIAGSSIKITAGVTPTSGSQAIGISTTGGPVYISWKASLPSSYTAGNPPITCTANSSAGDWTGGSNMPSVINGTTTATSSVTENGNGTANMISNTYTISCDHIGNATATVNIPPANSGNGSNGGIIPGSAIGISVGLTPTSGTQSINMPSTGGTAYIAWKVTLPPTYSPTTDGVVACTANSSAGDWVGGGSIPSTIDATTIATSTVLEAADNGNDNIYNTYTINCGNNIGQATATVNISSLLNGGFIKGASVTLTANGSTSKNIPYTGGPIALAWKVTLPNTYTGNPVIACTASSSLGDWSNSNSGLSSYPTISHTTSATSSVTEVENDGTDVVSNTYSITCDHIPGPAFATVNINTSGTGLGILNNGLTLTVDNQSSEDKDWNGGPATLQWKIVTDAIPTASSGSLSGSGIQNFSSSSTSTSTSPGGSNPHGPVCVANSSAGDWSGLKTYDDSGKGYENITIPSNVSTSTESQTYSLTCAGMGTQIVAVNTNISPDAFEDRTPGFTFTVDGGTNTTITPGTPVELKWDVKNLNANSCIGTSAGTSTAGVAESYAGWGNTYTITQDTFTPSQQILHDALVASTTSIQAQLTALTVTATTTNTTTIQNQITNLNGQIANVTASTTVLNGQVTATQADLASTTATITNLNTQLSNTQTKFNALNTRLNEIAPEEDTEFLSGWTLDAITLDDIDTAATSTLDASSTLSLLQEASSTINTTILPQISTNTAHKTMIVNTTLPALQSSLTGLQTTKANLLTQVGQLQTQINGSVVGTQVAVDNTKALEVQSLQYQLQTYQTQLDSLNALIAVNHLHLIAQGGTIKQPFFNVGPTATSFSETAGLENVVVTGTIGGGTGVFTRTGTYQQTSGVPISGGDGSGGGIVGDVPITGNRVYTLTCTGANGVALPPQSVTVNVDTTQGNPTNTNQSVVFLGNGSANPTINIGDPVTLTWEVSNIPANSCFATSPEVIQGWGNSYQTVRHIKKANGTIVDSSTAVLQQGDFEFNTTQLVPDPGGTLKAPSTDVGSNSQTFSETVGDKTPITTNTTYQLTCGNLPMQTVTVNIDNTPSITFLADGQSSEDVDTGTPVVLSWSLENIQGGSCRGTSTGNTAAGSGGNFIGWGAAAAVGSGLPVGYNSGGSGDVAINTAKRNLFNTVMDNIGGSISSMFSPDTAFALTVGTRVHNEQYQNQQRQELLYTTVTVVAGGTVKPPTSNVTGISQDFSETVGQDGSITTGVERDYTLTCTGLDGSTVFKTVIINGPGDINGGGNNTNSNNTVTDSSNPCDNDLDIKTAQVQLATLESTYTTLTGISITDFGDPTVETDTAAYQDAAAFAAATGVGSSQNLNDQSGGLEGECYSEATNGDVADANGFDQSYVWDPVTKQPTGFSQAREVYDTSLIPWNLQWITNPAGGGYVDPIDYNNPLPGWKWGYYSYVDSNGNTQRQDYTQDPTQKYIWAGDLADGIILGGQTWSGTGIGQLGYFWLSDTPGDLGHMFNTADPSGYGFNNGNGHPSPPDTTNTNVTSTCADNLMPVEIPASQYSVYGISGTIGNGSAGRVHLPIGPLANGNYISFDNPDQGAGTACNNMETGYDYNNIYSFLAYRTDATVANADTYTTSPSDTGCFGAGSAVTDPNGRGQQYYAQPLCGPGVFGAKYQKGSDNVQVQYWQTEMPTLGKLFGY